MASPTLLRSGVEEVAQSAVDELVTTWAQVETMQQAQALLADTSPGLIEQFGTVAAAYAAAWYDLDRIDFDMPGSFVADVPTITYGSRSGASLASWVADEARDIGTALTLASGGLQRRVANAARDIIQGASTADAAADGWQRVASSGACSFCLALASKGAVYSEASVDFGAHDHCNCGAVPKWGGQPLRVRPFTPRRTQRSEAARKATREWAAEHAPT